MEHYCRC